MKHIAVLHSLGYVHSNILPQIFVFSGDEGHLIDFDLLRPED